MNQAAKIEDTIFCVAISEKNKNSEILVMVVCFLHFFSCIRKPSGKDNRFHMADTIINMRRTYRHGVNVKETISHLQNERIKNMASLVFNMRNSTPCSKIFTKVNKGRIHAKTEHQLRKCLHCDWPCHLEIYMSVWNFIIPFLQEPFQIVELTGLKKITNQCIAYFVHSY